MLLAVSEAGVSLARSVLFTLRAEAKKEEVEELTGIHVGVDKLLSRLWGPVLGDVRFVREFGELK